MSKRVRGELFSRAYSMKDRIIVYCDERLKALVGAEADRVGLPLSDYITKLLAEYHDRPELSVIPRAKMGRPRKAIAV